jgi:hypothetical protein
MGAPLLRKLIFILHREIQFRGLLIRNSMRFEYFTKLPDATWSGLEP